MEVGPESARTCLVDSLAKRLARRGLTPWQDGKVRPYSSDSTSLSQHMGFTLQSRVLRRKEVSPHTHLRPLPKLFPA